ncbi:MAG: BatD family protein [Fibrobacteraceae bacterium]|nr:BatD family protein [Fibrobacteraceae bacterium]
MKRLFFFILLAAVFAQARISLEYDRDRIDAGSSFELRVVVPLRELAEPRDIPKFAPSNGFSLRGMDSTDTQVQDFFGRGFSVRKYNFKLTAPKKTGRSIAGILTWTIQGTEYELARPEISVQKSFDDAALSVALTPSKYTVYEGEQLSVTLSLHTYEHFQGNLAALNMDLGNDFIAHRSDLSNLQFTRVPNAPQESEASAKFAWLSPVKTGTVSIPAFKFKYTKIGAPKVVEENKSSGGFSMSFKSIRQEPIDAEASTVPIRINVLPLPTANRPDNFSGMVGDYSFTASFDKDSLKVGEALTLSVLIKGDGKPGTITDPELPNLSDFRSVPPETDINKNVVQGKVITSKNIRVFLYPKKKGEFEIPAITYTWFDPNQKKYKSKTQGPWKIKVEKGDGNATYASDIPAPQAAQKEDIENLGSDIRYMHNLSNIKIEVKPFYKSALFWMLLILPIILYIIFCAFIRRYRKNLGNAALVRKAKAQANLKKYTTLAKEALAKNDGKAFYAALENGLVGYLSDLSNLEFRGMTKDFFRKNLNDLGLTEDKVKQVSDWMEACAFARFAPSEQTAVEREDALQKFEALCNTLEILK